LASFDKHFYAYQNLAPIKKTSKIDAFD